MRGRGRDFVVDADLGRGAASADRLQAALRAGLADTQRNTAFARTLDAVLEGRHRAVFSPQLLSEWLRQRPMAGGKAVMGRAGRRWLARMTERALVITLREEPRSTLVDDAIERLPVGAQPVALKDAHLVAAALLHDHRIISGDARSRRHFESVADGWPAVYWADGSDPRTRQWLLERAPDDARFVLATPEP